jgi:hypothetical protein
MNGQLAYKRGTMTGTGVEAPRGRRAKGAAVTAAVVLLAALALAPMAPAAYDPLGTGTTRLVFDKSFLALLKRDSVSLSAKAPARLKAGALTLPISGGQIDPTVGKGEIEQEGALVFSGRRKVPLKSMVVETKHSPLIAKVGGSQLKVVTSAKIASKRVGFGTQFSARQLKLTDKVAMRLNKKLRPPVPFVGGQLLGSVVSKTEPLTTTILERNRTTLSFDAAFLAKLNSRFVSLNPISPAELAPGSLFTLPMIPKGAISPDGQTGVLRTGGSIEFLQLHAAQIFWHELWFDLGAKQVLAEVDIEPAPPYPGKLNQAPILDLDTGPATFSSDPKARTITVNGARIILQAATAAAFNAAFAEGKETFKAGEVAGTISFTAQAQ